MEATQPQDEIQAYVRKELEKLTLKDGKLTQDELKAAAEYLAALVEETPASRRVPELRSEFI